MKIEFPTINSKLAFFDFDRTLIAHDYSAEYIKSREEGYLMECFFMLTSLKEEHSGDRPLPCMQWYAKKLSEEGYGLYCLTHEIFNLRDQIKKDQLALYYSDTPMTYLTVDTPEHKIDMMTAVAMAEGCDLSDIIFVDDQMSTVYAALAAGINAKHLSDIVQMYESRKISEQQNYMLEPENNAVKPKEIPAPLKIPVDEKHEDEDSGISEMELNRICREYWIMSGKENTPK